jgi:hypothetical protein
MEKIKISFVLVNYFIFKCKINNTIVLKGNHCILNCILIAS